MQNLITGLLFALSRLSLFWLLVSSAFSVLKNRSSLPGFVAFGCVPRFCFTILFFLILLLVPGLYFVSCCWPGFNFFAYIVYIYKLYINTYIYYLILSLLQICMLPGFVFCASYARTHVYRSRFAISAMKARTHFCVFNGVVFSVDGCFSSYSSDFVLFRAFLLATRCLFPQRLPLCFLSCLDLRFWCLICIL